MDWGDSTSFLEALCDLFRSPQTGLEGGLGAGVTDRVTVLANKPKSIVYWCFERFDVFFGGSDFDVRVRAETERVFVPPCHIAGHSADLFLEVELRCETNEVLKNLFFG